MMRQKGGRPKGITIESSQAELERYQKASVGFGIATAPTTHVALTSPTVFSTLSDLSNVSDLSNTRPMYAFNLPAKDGIEM
jgi:hypothetical protein